MEYTVGSKLQWKPVYFKWDTAKAVQVVKVYQRGYALLDNGFIVDRHGYAEWHGRVAGTVAQ